MIILWERILDVLAPLPSNAGGDKRNLPLQKFQTARSNTLSDLQNFANSIDFVKPNKQSGTGRGKLIIFEDNDPVIKMTNRSRAPTMRHVPRTHRVDLDFLFELLREDPSIFIRYVGTKEQIADIFTKGSFTADQWRSLLRLAQIGSIPSFTKSSILAFPQPRHIS